MSLGYVANASFGQRQLRIVEILHPGQSTYALPLLLEVAGTPDTEALRQAVAAVVARHDILRAAFPLVDDVPSMAVRDAVDLPVPETVVVVGSRDDWWEALRSAADEFAARPFDLDAGPLLRAGILRAETHGIGLVVVFHHIIADGASLEIFARDLIAAYDAATAGGEPAWEDLPLQFSDYADWEEESFADPAAPEMAAAIGAWRNRLRGVPATLSLPFDHLRGPGGARRSGVATLHLDGPAGARLSAFARERGATPFLAFLALFFAVIRRWSALEDVVVTIPVSKRTRPELAGLVGLLVDTLPIRVQLDAELHFAGLLEAVRREFLDALRHRNVPFDRILQAIGIERHGDTTPLMQVLFGELAGATTLPAARDGTRFSVVDERVDQAAKTDLSFIYRQTEDGLDLWCRYDAALFEPATVERLLTWFGTIAARVVEEPFAAIDEIPLASDVEGRALLARFNDTRRPYPDALTVADLFFDIAEAHPRATAIETPGAALSYGDLAQRARRLATVLAEEGVGRGDAVVLAMEPSPALIEAILAVLTLGAIYVPVDPAHPQARQAQMIGLVDARVVLASAGGGPEMVRCLDLTGLEARIAAAALHPGTPVSSGDAAYIMFTSGSTGTSKGVAVPHRAIIRLVRNTDFCDFGPATRSAVYSNPSFDAATLEIWAPLLNGGTAVPVDREAIMDAARLRSLLAERQINLLWMTAGLFQQVVAVNPAVFAGARTVLTGGDVVNPDAARAVVEASDGSGLRLLNGYGPTENTTFSTTFAITGADDVSTGIPIGRPIANSTAYVLDRRGRPLPTGLVGEIYVGGDGVALGYVGDAEMTAARFMPDPFADRPDATMYRTGDLGRWRPDGTLQFVGRADDQVKVRGFRIELNEIAVALARHPQVDEVCVVAPRFAGGERRIVAYFVASGNEPPQPGALRIFLGQLLAPHMLPHAYVALQEMPLTVNGKVDRSALPEVAAHHYDRSAGVVAPRNDDERLFAGLWCDLLGLPEVGVHENFFQVGGDSILAIRLVARATEAGARLSPKDVFEHPTVAELAALVAGGRRRTAGGAAGQFYPVDLVPSPRSADAGAAIASVALPGPVDLVDLGFAVQRVAACHEALRLRMAHDGVGRRITVTDLVASFPVRTVTVPGLTEAGVDAWVAGHRDRLCRGLDLAHGVSVAVTLVNGAARPTLVVALHRAVADDRAAVLVAGEIEALLHPSGPTERLAEAPPSFTAWLDWLDLYTRRTAAGRPFDVLSGMSDAGCFVPAFRTPQPLGRIVAEKHLPATLTETLVGELPARLAVSPIDILLAALACVVASGAQGYLPIETSDANRTIPPGAPAADLLVGNLAMAFPAVLPLRDGTAQSRLRVAKIARQATEALGATAHVFADSLDLPAAAMGLAWQLPESGDGRLRAHTLPDFSPSVAGALLAGVNRGRLRLRWVGAEPEAGAAAVLDRIAEELTAIAGIAATATAPLHTPADMPLASLDADTLDGLIGGDGSVLDVYPLSPMQEAMLVHSLTSPASEVNFEQSCTRFRGHVDLDAFVRAWEMLFARHDVLRTTVRWRGLDRPLQVVRRTIDLPLTIEDWPEFDQDRLDERLAQDRREGFDLERGPLARLLLIRAGKDEIYLVTSFHHLIVDGWCLSRLDHEVRAAYEAIRAKRPHLLPPSAPYRDYIAWLAQADRTQCRRHFSDLLRDAPHQRPLRRVAPQRGYTVAHALLDEDASRALNAFARRHGATAAALLHLAWGLWTAAKRGSADVVFGTTVSGRPTEVAGVERIVGLFVNNLPVRLRMAAGARVGDLLAEIQRQLGNLQANAHISQLDVLEAAAANDERDALFDSLVVVENVPSGTSAWADAAGLMVESVYGRLKTAYDLTFVAIPGERIALSLILPDADGSAEAIAASFLSEVTAILTQLPPNGDMAAAELSLPAAILPSTAEDAGARSRPASQIAGRPRSTMEAHIANAVADLAAADIDLDIDFGALGLDSLAVARLAARLGRKLDRPVPVSMLLEHRSVARLAVALGRRQKWDPVVRMRDGTDEPFVCVHPIAGDVSAFVDLARAMPDGLPFWAVQAPGLEAGQTPLATVEELAEMALAALAERGLPQPSRIGGYSFGGLVAYEMARRLAARGTAPRTVIIDTPAPLERRSILSDDPDRAAAEWLVQMAAVRARHHARDVPLAVEELLALPACDRFALALARLRDAGLVPDEADAPWLGRAHATSLAQYDAYLAYAPDPTCQRGLDVAIIRAETQREDDLGEAERRQLCDPLMGWAAFVDPPTTVRTVPGDHVTMLACRFVDELAGTITGLLAHEATA